MWLVLLGLGAFMGVTWWRWHHRAPVTQKKQEDRYKIQSMRQRIRSLHRRGYDVPEIARATGMSATYIRSLLNL